MFCCNVQKQLCSPECVCLIPRRKVWAPHRHPHYPQRGRPRLRGRARWQLRPGRQWPRWQAPPCTTQDHPDTTSWLHGRRQAVNEDGRGVQLTAVIFHPKVNGSKQSMLSELYEEGFGTLGRHPPVLRCPVDEHFISRREKNIVSNAAFMSRGKDKRYELPHGNYCWV